MEICILKFKRAHEANKALENVIDAQADRYPWLHDVGVVRRPVLGKISISATFADDDQPTQIKQGDLVAESEDAGAMTGYAIGSLVGPLHADMAAMEGAARASVAGKELEDELMFIDDIKRELPRGSSALVLIAEPDINDKLIELFASQKPEVVRRDLAEEAEQRLHQLEDKVKAAAQEQYV